MAGKVFRHNRNKATVFFEVEKDDESLIRFDCRPAIAGGIVLAFTDMVGGGGDDQSTEEKVERGKGAIQVVKDLLGAAIVPAQQQLFWDMLYGRSDQGMIDTEQMMAIAEHLGEAYTERPTSPSSEAGSQTTDDGDGSRDGQPPAVLTYSRLKPVGASTSSSTGESLSAP